MACLDERSALAILDRGVAVEEQAALAVHLDECEWCRRLVAEIARGSEPAERGEARQLARGAQIGRFTIDHELGRGSMGVVYAAYDPELDRYLALKLLHRTGDAGEQAELEARLLAEARTMARLAHPNVVPVYEVGRDGDALFIAMERVEGDTLREWLGERPRTIDERLAVLVDAARGLAAAHALGLVHRDFKPENVLVGGDGRARVGDFGLARASATAAGEPRLDGLTATGELVGTPAYMAPEQLAGEPADAQSDQFSFCVVMYEVLFGQRPFAGATFEALAAAITRGERAGVPRVAPRRVRTAIERGVAVARAARFPTMDVLIAELERPSFVRRRPALAIGGALAAGAAIVLGVLALRGGGAAEPPCTGAPQQLAAIWNADRRHALEASFARTGSPLAADAFARTAIALDQYTSAWTALHTESCAATRVRGEASEALLDRRMACLAQRKGELAALVDLLTDRGEAAGVERAPAAVASLASPAACTTPDGDADPVTPEASTLHGALDRANALTKLGRGGEATPLLSPLIDRARTLSLPHLRAQALFARGTAELAQRRDREAAADFEESSYAAQSIKSDELAAKAGSMAIVAYSDAGDLTHARGWVRPAAAAVARVGADSDEPAELAAHLAWLDRATGDLPSAETHAREAVARGCRHAAVPGPQCAHLDVLGTVQFEQGKWADALATYRRNAELVVQQLGPDHPDVARTWERVANALDKLGRHGEALALYDRALAIANRRPSTGSLASLLDNSGSTLMAIGRDREAEARMRRALAIHEEVQGADHPEVAITLVNLANVLDREARAGEATALRERALAVAEKSLGPEHPLVAQTLVQIAYRHIADHHPQKATPLLERALAIGAAHHAPADPYMVAMLGAAELDAGELAKAVTNLERALAALDVPAPSDPELLADVRFNLADALWRSHGDRTRARALAAQSRAWRARPQAEPADAEAAAEAARWLDRHRL